MVVLDTGIMVIMAATAVVTMVAIMAAIVGGTTAVMGMAADAIH